MILRRLTVLRMVDSELTGSGILKANLSSQPPKCLRPTPQKILLSPSLGNINLCLAGGDWVLVDSLFLRGDSCRAYLPS